MSAVPEIIRFPGVIDLHTHSRALSEINRAENYETATRAAAIGGIEVVGDMTNDPGHEVKTLVDVLTKHEFIMRDAYTKVMVYGGSQPEWNNQSEVKKMIPYVGGFKFYAGTTTGNKGDVPVSSFEESIDIINAEAPMMPIMVHLGKENTEDFIYEIAGKRNHPLYICHVRPMDMPYIVTAKQKGWPVYAEICPHHLLLTSKDAETRGWFARMQPPLLPQVDVELMWHYVNNGIIDTLGSDHAPHPVEAKWETEHANPHGDPDHDCTCFGVPSLEHWVKLMFRQVQLGNLSIERLEELAVTNPARIFGIDPETIPKYTWEMSGFRIEDEDSLLSGSGFTPFLGMLGVGTVVSSPVVHRGLIVHKKPEVVIPRGRSHG